jgi:N-acetylneuraminic acid mutarotase
MKHLSKIISCFLTFLLLLQFFYFVPKPQEAKADQTWTISSQSEFQQGTVDSNADLIISPGDITLSETLSTTTDDTKDDFDLGHSEGYNMTTQNTTEGSVSLSKVFNYNIYSTPAIGYSDVDYSVLEGNKYLYVSTYGGGLSVIDTKGTASPSDDTLVITYSTASIPAIAGNRVWHSWLDTTNNLLYVSTSGGLSVINTQGTAITADDTLVITYSTASTPAIANNLVFHSWLDTANNLLYVSTGGGLSVINTKGTATISDDTLAITYSTASIPAIANNNVQRSWLDTANNLLYVSTGGGLSVINTHGTATTSDDTLWKNYTTTPTPAIASNNVFHSWLDSTSNLLYVSTDGGLSVIDTKGTATTTDDTLAITYKANSTPAIASNSTYHSWLDSATNYLYVSTNKSGLSVIDTKGTATTTDDAFVITYSTSSSPAISGNNTIQSWKYPGTDYLYVSNWYTGLSVISPGYHNSGAYIRNINFSSGSLSWQTKADMPSTRMAAGSGVIDDKIYIVGGTTSGPGDEWKTGLSSLVIYDPANNTWDVSKPSMSTNRTTPLAGVINNKLYVVGGRGSSYSTATSSLLMYDPDPLVNAWVYKAPMLSARIGPAGGVYNGKLYVVGGSDEGGGKTVQSLEVYDPGTDTWETKAPAPIVRAVGATAQFIDGKMYLIGGQTDSSTPFSDTLAVYDVMTDSWDITKALMPARRTGGTSAVVDGKFLYIGGTNEDYDSASDVYIYDPAINSWDNFGDLPLALHRAVAQVVNSDLFIIGGRNSDWDAVAPTYKLSSDDYPSDADLKELYSYLSWSATTPSGTTVELLYSTDSGATYTSCGTTPTNCYLPFNTRAYSLTYKATLTTTNTTITPSLDDVTVHYALEATGLFNASGTYTSPILDTAKASFDTLSWTATTPTSTNITFKVRTGNQADLSDATSFDSLTQTIVNGVTDLSTLQGVTDNQRYFQYQATLTTSASSTTPTLSAVSLTYDDDPTNLTTTNITSQSITVSADSFPNATSGNSGYYFANSTKGTNSGWIQTNSWQDTNLTCPTTYTYSVKYRNGDATQTSTTTRTFVTDGCAGYTPPAQTTSQTNNSTQQTEQPTATSTNSTSTITSAATTTQSSATTTQQTSTVVTNTSQTNQAKQAQVQQIRTQISDVKQQIIVWLTQLVQIVQEQILELQKQLSQL